MEVMQKKQRKLLRERRALEGGFAELVRVVPST